MKRELRNSELQAQCRYLMRVDEPEAKCRLKTSFIANLLGIEAHRVRYLSTLHLRQPAVSIPKSKDPRNVNLVAEAIKHIGLETLTV